MIIATERWITPILFVPDAAGYVPRPVGAVTLKSEAEDWLVDQGYAAKVEITDKDSGEPTKVITNPEGGLIVGEAESADEIAPTEPVAFKKKSRRAGEAT